MVSLRQREGGQQLHQNTSVASRPLSWDEATKYKALFDSIDGGSCVVHVRFDTMVFFSGMDTLGFAPRANADAHSFLRSGAESPSSTPIYYGIDTRPKKDWAIRAPDTANIPSFEILMGEPERVDTVYRDALKLLAERIAKHFISSSPLKAAAP